MQCEYTRHNIYNHILIQSLDLSQIDDGKVMDLKCPNPTCAKELTAEVMSAVVRYHLLFPVFPFYLTNNFHLKVNENTFKRYQQFYLLASLRKDPTVRWCIKYVFNEVIDFPDISCF